MASCFRNLSCCCFSRMQPDEDDEEEVRTLDYSHCGLLDVPDNIFLHERTLEKLLLHSNRIIELPWSIFNCRYLKLLNVRDNSIEALPDAINLLTSLEHLDVGHNSLTELPPSLRECKKLKIIDMSMNPIGVLPDVVTQISSLEELYLNDVSLTILTANVGRLRNLKILELRGNKLSFLPSSCSKLVHLIKLDIGMNKIIESPSQFHNFRHLKELYYDTNGVKILQNLSSFSCLKVFELEDNNLHVVPKEIGFCKNVVHLSFEGNCLKMLPNEIGLLESLETLKLNDNAIGEVPITLGSMKNLQELYLSDNKLRRLPSSIGLLRKLVILHVDRNRLGMLPPEIGSCISLRILSLQRNHLKEVPAEIGNLVNLSVLALTSNYLNYLPISFFKLENLKSLWLTYNQGKPLTGLQRMYDADSHTYVATCYLLPQRPSDEKKPINDHPSELVTKPRSACRIKFANESDEKRGSLTRVPTPIPLTMKRIARQFQKGGTPGASSDNTDAQNNQVVIKSAIVDQVPSSSSLVRTAVVRRQANELYSTDGQHENVNYTNSNSEDELIITASSRPALLSSLSSPLCENENMFMSRSNSVSPYEGEFKGKVPKKHCTDEPEYVYPSSECDDVRSSVSVSKSNTPVRDGTDRRESIGSDSPEICGFLPVHVSSPNDIIMTSINLQNDSSALPKKALSPSSSSTPTCASVTKQNSDDGSANSNVKKHGWVFGKHQNALVIPVIIKKLETGIGFLVTNNEHGDIVISHLESNIQSSPELQIGDKVLQIDHTDIRKDDSAESVNSFLAVFKPGLCIPVVISRLNQSHL